MNAMQRLTLCLLMLGAASAASAVVQRGAAALSSVAALDAATTIPAPAAPRTDSEPPPYEPGPYGC